ncbi:MAG: hypothetical protein EB084_14735 [Proteobacteria bacterium]|nr:hypothetical protein [Pseudomonadota bacterium]
MTPQPPRNALQRNRPFNRAALTLALFALAASAAVSRMMWIPISGPMYKAPKKHYATISVPLVAPGGGAATGSVRLYCNAGDDADRLVVRASGLAPSARCMLWFADGAERHVGEPFEVAADVDGTLHFTVHGALCALKDAPLLLITVGGGVVLRADLRAPSVPSSTPMTPTASPSAHVPDLKLRTPTPP